MIKSCYLLLFLCFLSACTEKVIFEEKKEIGTSLWSYDDPIQFVIPEADTSGLNELQLIIEHNKEYAYENVYLKVYTSFPDGNTKEERLSINLADKQGKWIGKCSGNNCKIKVFLMEKFKFPKEGNYAFTFEQNSRTEKLSAIQSLELRLLTVK